MNAILECKGLSKSYGRFQALDHVDLTLEPGKIIGLLGPNGSGKTTFIKLINQLLVPDEGTLLIDGNAPGVESKSIISYLPEKTYLDENQKIAETLDFFADFYDDFDKRALCAESNDRSGGAPRRPISSIDGDCRPAGHL